MSCRFAHDDAAYVLGALSPTERRDYEEHLAGCADCSRAVGLVAGLPGLLSRLSPQEVPAEPEVVPASLLPRLVQQVEHARRRRRRIVVAVAAAGVAAATVLGTVAVRAGADGSTPPPTVAAALAPVGDAPITATATISSLAWGTAVDLSCTYAPTYGSGPTTYTLVAVDRAGAVDQLARWQATPGQVSRVTGATSWLREDIASLQIRTLSGVPVMRLDG